MRIVSWNVCFRNSNFENAFIFIESLDADLICLQEVPQNLLERLKTLPYYCATSVDVERLFDDGVERNYLVILSKYPIRNSGSVSFDVPHLPVRTRLFVWLMKQKGWSKIQGRTALWADVEIHGTLVRVFCLHLLLAHPSVRAKEFELALGTKTSCERIVCGDLNILESPKATLLNWILGGPFSDFLHFKRERSDMNVRFAAHTLVNPLRGKATHNFSSRQQLAHILVPQNAKILRAEVLPDYYGSDHRPIALTCDI